MADSRDDPRVFLLDPDERGVLPLTQFHVPRRLRRTVRQDRYHMRIDTAFAEVVAACAAARPGREQTWINDRILTLYTQLHAAGHAHSVECWEGDALVGGLYGVRMGAAFFGESMFSTARDASKVALAHLVARLLAGGYQLLDTQFITAHLRQFGACEISREDYRSLLSLSLSMQGDFRALALETNGEQALDIIDRHQSGACAPAPPAEPAVDASDV